mgnify:CR=1 FL=1
MDINNIIEQIKPIDRQKVEEAQNRFDNLIKPVGSLAKLEAMVSRYAGIIGSADKKSVQYPKKALFLWSADTDSVAKAMQEGAACCFAGTRRLKQRFTHCWSHLVILRKRLKKVLF